MEVCHARTRGRFEGDGSNGVCLPTSSGRGPGSGAANATPEEFKCWAIIQGAYSGLLIQRSMVHARQHNTYLLVNPSARQRICTGATLLHNDMHATAHPHPSASLTTIALLNTLADTDRNTEPQSLSPHKSASAPGFSLHRPSHDSHLKFARSQSRQYTWSGP